MYHKYLNLNETFLVISNHCVVATIPTKLKSIRMIDIADNIVEDLPFYGQEIWASHLYRGVIFISIGFKTSSSNLLKKDITEVEVPLPIYHCLIWSHQVFKIHFQTVTRALVVLSK